MGVTAPAFAVCVALSCFVQEPSRRMVFRGKEIKEVEIHYGAG